MRAASLNASALFLAWAKPSHTRRSELMARQLGVPLHRIHVLKMKPWLAPVRYLTQSALTLTTLFRERPALVFVQNPPIFAPLFVWLYCALTGSRFIIDAHTDALHGSLWKWSWPLHAFLSRRALTTLVTNEHLRSVVSRWNAPAHVITDVPSDLPEGIPYAIQHPFNVVMVSSWAPDEPLEAVIAAARRLPEIGIYVTGDPVQGFKRVPTDLPPNVHLTGFLLDEAYYGLLRSVQAVMALTTEDHTNQRGACEGVWLNQPILTSDWPVLRRTFHLGTVHVDNTSDGIYMGLVEMRAEHTRLKNDIRTLQAERRAQWETFTTQLIDLVGDQRG